MHELIRFSPLEPGERKALEDFLADSQRHEDALDIWQLQGFLFALAACPDAPDPDAWLPVVFGENGDEERHPEFSDLVLRLHAEIRQEVEAGDYRLPEACVFSWDNHERRFLDAWVEGFLMTDEWLEDHWRRALKVATHKNLDGVGEFAEALDEILAFMQIYA
ncbi:MAG: YecA family protein, partial [Gammaproteobacteria bacterium]